MDFGNSPSNLIYARESVESAMQHSLNIMASELGKKIVRFSVQGLRTEAMGIFRSLCQSHCWKSWSGDVPAGENEKEREISSIFVL